MELCNLREMFSYTVYLLHSVLFHPEKWVYFSFFLHFILSSFILSSYCPLRLGGGWFQDWRPPIRSPSAGGLSALSPVSSAIMTVEACNHHFSGDAFWDYSLLSNYHVPEIVWNTPNPYFFHHK